MSTFCENCRNCKLHNHHLNAEEFNNISCKIVEDDFVEVVKTSSPEIPDLTQDNRLPPSLLFRDFSKPENCATDFNTFYRDADSKSVQVRLPLYEAVAPPYTDISNEELVECSCISPCLHKVSTCHCSCNIVQDSCVSDSSSNFSVLKQTGVLALGAGTFIGANLLATGGIMVSAVTGAATASCFDGAWGLITGRGLSAREFAVDLMLGGSFGAVSGIGHLFWKNTLMLSTSLGAVRAAMSEEVKTKTVPGHTKFNVEAIPEGAAEGAAHQLVTHVPNLIHCLK